MSEMEERETKIIEIPEITRVEGHAAVVVEIVEGKVETVKLDVFEGTRFFEKIVIGHHFSEIPHITSRVCAICSTGHVLAAIFAVENLVAEKPSHAVTLIRELMHLGMIIESHSTHLFALALPDFLGTKDLLELATKHPLEFESWNKLRNLGSMIQTVIGGRAFHPVNLQVGGFSHVPSSSDLHDLLPKLSAARPLALDIAEFMAGVKVNFSRITTPTFLALIPFGAKYGYFGEAVQSSAEWAAPVSQYREYLGERVVARTHAKRSSAKGQSLMVGSMARLTLFHQKLTGEAANLFRCSAIASGDFNTIWNNLGQAIEIVQAIDRCEEIIQEFATISPAHNYDHPPSVKPVGGSAVGAVECPRGTLYHAYSLDVEGRILAADMITPSAQNTGRIEQDIREVVDQCLETPGAPLQGYLETLVRAYDPCNTCATHMVQVQYR